MPPKKGIVDCTSSNSGRRLDKEQPQRNASKRPGQQPPEQQPRKHGCCDAASGDSTDINSDGDDDDVDEDDIARSTSKFWEERMSKQGDTWDARQVGDVEMLIAMAPAMTQRQERQRAAAVAAVQEELNSLQPLCCSKAAHW